MRITLVTSNRGKFEEASLILKDWDLVHADIDLQEIQGSREEVIRAKADAAMAILNRPLIVEDVSLCCPALNGLPGPYAKDFLRILGPQGLSELIRRYDDHRVSAVCMLAYAEPGAEPLLFEGTIDGTVVEPRGERKHGKYSFNQILQPEGHSKTMGELTLEEHASISHRRRAYIQLHEHFASKGP